ncbi:MAG: Ig-like domain-containing protein [Sedimentisphaerales bacterium]|nr:Ig-like domain-containing protein [Sedimentisphaerales bacterium]
MGLLIFDTNDITVSTSLLELGEPYGVTVTGNHFFVHTDPNDPNYFEFMPSDPPPGSNAFQVTLPVDPGDPNCYLIPSGLDESTLEATATAIETVIIPEIESIISELDSIADSPTRFRFYLQPEETGSQSAVEVDYAEVLALKGLLEGAKAGLLGLADPAYNFLINPYTSPFSGKICDIFYQFNGVLSAYPDLLRVVPTTGTASLAQAKTAVIAGIDDYLAVVSYIESEIDPQMDDLIYIDPNATGPLSILESRLLALKTSLQTGNAVTYPWLTTRTYAVWQDGTATGPLTITYDVTGFEIARAELTAFNPTVGPSGPPVVWEGDWGGIHDNDLLEIDFEYGDPGAGIWFWGTFRGTLSGNNINNATFSYQGWGSSGWVSLEQDNMTVAGPSATDVTNLRFNLNPIFAGTVDPRDMLPQFDPNNYPIPGTFGHGLGDDPTLGGVLPDMTQEMWIPQGYEVWGFDAAAASEVEDWLLYEDMRGDPPGSTRLGRSAGQTMAFAGTYDYYLVLAIGEVLIDSIKDPNGMAVQGVVFDDYYVPTYIEGLPDGVFVTVGENVILARAFDEMEYYGAVGVENTGGWEGITVVTGTGQNVVTATAAPTYVAANGLSEIEITITVKDASGNPVEGIPGGVFEVTAPGDGLLITPPMTATDASGQTTATISSTEAHASVDVSVSLYGQTYADLVTIEFVSGDATKLVFTAQPEGPYGAGATINAIPEVEVQDALGNTVTSSSAEITISIGTNPGGGTLSGDTSVNAVDGVATFDDLSINKAGEGYTLTATATGLTSATSNAFTIVPASADPQLVFTTSPEETAAMGILTPNPVVTVQDLYGNTRTDVDDAITVSVSGGDTGATLGGTTTVSAISGVATFDDLTLNRAADGYVLTAAAPGFTSGNSAPFNITAEPALAIEKGAGVEEADAGDEVVFTIEYTNAGLADATNVVIVETLPTDLEFVSADSGGVHDAGTITWTLADIPAETTTALEVSFTASIAESLSDGGTVTNSSLTIDCDETDPVSADPLTLTVNDTQAPVITPLVPEPDDEEVDPNSIVKLVITDASGVDYAGSTVTIRIEGDLVYNGAAESLVGQYDSRSSDQEVRGICRRTPTEEGATAYTFTFVPSTTFRYEQQVDVVVEATDEAGNAADLSYSYWTELRSFGPNAKVNSDTGTLVQDNPATASDAAGNIWVVWDQRASGTGHRGVYVGKLAAGAPGFAASVAVADSNDNEQDPTIAVDADGVAYVAWQQDDPNGHWDIYLSSSSDGTTWSTPIKLNAGDPCNLTDQTAPALAIDTTSAVPNRMYAAWQSNEAGHQDIWLGTSTGGSTWDTLQITDNSADQTYPVVAVDENRVAYVLWTDARNAGTTGTDIWGAGSDVGPWDPCEVVEAPGDQYGPVIATSEILHAAWVTDVNGFGEVMYANDGGGMPLFGTSIGDATEPNAVQRMPALVVSGAGERDAAFACWEDGRNVDGNSDTDIYFAESGSPFGTNILVNDDIGTSPQTKPAIGLDADGNPYMVWVDRRRGNDDIYYAGATALVPVQTQVLPIPDSNDQVVVPAGADATSPLAVRIPVGALPAGVEPEDITISEISNGPQVPSSLGGFGLTYDFGPNGTVFDPNNPVTIRIPLDPNAPVYDVYNVYRYDPNDVTSPYAPWSEDGILNPAEVLGGGTYLEVDVTHFSVYGSGGTDLPAGGGGGGGGGCALAPWGDAGPAEFMLPFVLFVAILSVVTVVDLRRRRSGNRA